MLTLLICHAGAQISQGIADGVETRPRPGGLGTVLGRFHLLDGGLDG